ncbi:MAG: hypothetical protein J0M02_02475 [Planctomycetes bacterium]|nr:hypothetical protein [Planctomycetota bacterium]
MLQTRPKIDIQEVMFHSTVKRGMELSQSQIVRILGRRTFAKVRIGATSVSMGKEPKVQKGYSVNPLFSSPNERAMEEIARNLKTWLHACHGERCEIDSESLLKPGTSTIYLAVR